jgi:ABC-2 type transport system ATP-binding protein
MQRRLNLACALLHEPPLLLLDEPTVGLDVQSRDAVFVCLRRLRDRGCALVFTTHHLEEAELLCDRIGVMNAGRLLAVGALSELCGQWTGAVEPLVARRWRMDGAHGPVAARGVSLEQLYLELTGGSAPQS